MLTDQDKTDLHKLNAADKKVAITEQLHRIHVAVNDGTLDRESVDDALEQLAELTGTVEKDSFGDFTGQKGKGKDDHAKHKAA